MNKKKVNKPYAAKIYCSKCGRNIKECVCNRSKKIETKVSAPGETKSTKTTESK